MPGTYEVQNRAAAPAQGGLALPPPPAAGPIRLHGGAAGLRRRDMQVQAAGNVATYGYPGVWTTGISDCVVLAAVEWQPGVGWTNFCWEHLGGGEHQTWERTFRAQIGVPANCFALIAARYKTGTWYLADEFVKWGISPERITVYIARADFSFGLRFAQGNFGEV